MSVILDIIGATLLVGMLMLSIMNINVNIIDETTKTSSALHIQNEGLQVARILEFDFYKMGYRAPKAPATHKVTIADTSNIQFQAALFDSAMADTGRVYTVQYLYIPPTPPVTHKDSSTHRYGTLKRIVNGDTVVIDQNVTKFFLAYYDSLDNPMAIPITGTKLDTIRSVKVQLRFEAFVPFDTSSTRFRRAGDSTYTGAYYQKWIYPRNLHY